MAICQIVLSTVVIRAVVIYKAVSQPCPTTLGVDSSTEFRYGERSRIRSRFLSNGER